MVRVLRSRVIRLVATVAVQWWQSCSDVALGAGNKGVLAGERSESCGGVVKDRPQPIRHVMAAQASCRVIRRYVVRDANQSRSAVVSGLVARNAGRGQRRVIPARVATRARHVDVRPQQREGGLTMIEHRVRPRDRVMTQRAIHWELHSHVIRYTAANGRRRVVGIQVAARARRWHGRIVPAHVALRIHAAQRRHGVRVG